MRVVCHNNIICMVYFYIHINVIVPRMECRCICCDFRTMGKEEFELLGDEDLEGEGDRESVDLDDAVEGDDEEIEEQDDGNGTCSHQHHVRRGRGR